MRTTLIIDDALFSAARRRAAEKKTTLSAVVNDALRQAMTRPERARRRVTLPTAGDPRRKRRLSPADIAESLLEHP